MLKKTTLASHLIAAVFLCLAALAFPSPVQAQQKPVTAVDIVLEPGATMVQRAKDANARLLKAYPKGFALDETHHPHISVLQCYARTADLDRLYAAAGRVVAGENVALWKLKAPRYYYGPVDNLGLAGIVVEPTEALLALQQKLIDAVAPFTEKTGTAAAYVTTPEAPSIDQFTIDFIGAFVSKATGRNFHPHVTIGIGPREYLDRMLAEPFEAFTFSPEGVSVYQLGSYGTARKKLKAWK